MELAKKSRTIDAPWVVAQTYARGRGLCGDIGPFRHVCTQWADHRGKHQGVRVDDTDEWIYASWGDG